MTNKILKDFIREVLDGYAPLGRSTVVQNNLRFDRHIYKQGGNVLTDEEDNQQKEKAKVKKAACCLIMSEDGKVLAVSRKNNPSDFGMPGGSVDEGETFEEAAARELKEETGLIAVSLKKIMSKKDAHGFITTTFLCNPKGKIQTTESGVIRWVTPDVLISGMFGEYCKELFEKIEKMKISK